MVVGNIGAESSRSFTVIGDSAYRAQDWHAAEQGFAGCLAIHAGDAASRMFIDRIAQLRPVSLGSHWDGVWRMTGK